MAKNTTIYFTKEGNFGKASLGATGASDVDTVFTAGAEGSKLFKLGISAVNIGGAAQYLKVIVNDGTDKTIHYKTVAWTEDYDILAAMDLPTDKNNNKYLNLPAGAIVKVELSSTGIWTAEVNAYGEDY